MTDTLSRLLSSYEFLHLALVEHGSRMDTHEARRLRVELARAFSKIVAYSSQDVRVTVTQVRFIIANLERASIDPGVIRELQLACIQHLDRIAEYVEATTTPAKPVEGPRFKTRRRRPSILTEENFRPLDVLGDRASVFDTEFRYIFTNVANARFHREPASAFVGRPNSSIADPKVFESFL